MFLRAKTRIKDGKEHRTWSVVESRRVSGGKPEDRERVWLLLADLLFLDTEHSDAVYKSTAETLTRLGIKRRDAEDILIYEVAPLAGANLGYLLWPVIGDWAGFDREDLSSAIRSYLRRRASRSRWHYCLQDRRMRWMVSRLGAERLLVLLE